MTCLRNFLSGEDLGHQNFGPFKKLCKVFFVRLVLNFSPSLFRSVFVIVDDGTVLAMLKDETHQKHKV